MPQETTTFNWRLDWDSEVLAKQPSRPLRELPADGGVVEITTRTLHGMFLLLPGKEANARILGCLGRSLHVYPEVRLFGYAFLSNHYNLLAHFRNVETMAAFMSHLNSNLARELGALHEWDEKFWGRRYRGIVVVDERAEVDRLAYLLAQGTKEGLVARPADWPGVICLRALTEGVPDVGRWVDRTALYNARREGKKVSEEDFTVEYPIHLEPLPAWSHLPEEERRSRTRDLVEAIETKAAALMRKLGRTVMGAAKILRQNPHDAPKKIARSPAPLCHASTRKRFWAYANAYRTFVEIYRDLGDKLRAGDLSVLPQFPPGCFPPPARPRSYVSATSVGAGIYA